MKIAANELADAVMSELAAYSEEALNRLEESFKKRAGRRMSPGLSTASPPGLITESSTT